MLGLTCCIFWNKFVFKWPNSNLWSQVVHQLRNTNTQCIESGEKQEINVCPGALWQLNPTPSRTRCFEALEETYMLHHQCLFLQRSKRLLLKTTFNCNSKEKQASWNLMNMPNFNSGSKCYSASIRLRSESLLQNTKTNIAASSDETISSQTDGLWLVPSAGLFKPRLQHRQRHVW